MTPFTFIQAGNEDMAIAEIDSHAGSKFIAGGTNLVDLMRENIEQPDTVVDITHLPLAQVEEKEDGSVEIGALVRNSHLAAHPLIRQQYPVLSEALLNGASGQLRNMATTGGNLLQRTRCYYFYDETARCNKRNPGAGCDAIEGYNRIHAILGTSASCIATHPSDMAVAMAMLDATIHIKGKAGRRKVNVNELYCLPGDTPNIETVLQPGELITAVTLPSLPIAKHSVYRKVRDRASYAFAIVSVAAAIEVENGLVKDIRLAMGGVAPKPWRAYTLEKELRGKEASQASFSTAAEAELKNAKGYEHNAFKIGLAKRTIVNVLLHLTENV